MYEVTALGELLIDFTPIGQSDTQHALFQTNPGGAPANVLVALAKLDISTGFIGKVGDDQFGHFLKGKLKAHGVAISELKLTKEANTSLAFVHLDDEGDRSFHFYRDQGADTLLHADDIREEVIQSSKVFHFGSLSMTHEPSATATLTALSYAKKHEVMISFDPNLREALWDSLDVAKEKMIIGLKHADVVKLSIEELEFITGATDLEAGTEKIQEAYGCSLIFITLGSKGCFYRTMNGHGEVEGYVVQVADTTGAGDAFVGGALYKILESNKRVEELVDEEVQEIARFANAVGALATVNKGAIPSMPTKDRIERLMYEGVSSERNSRVVE